MKIEQQQVFVTDFIPDRHPANANATLTSDLVLVNGPRSAEAS